MPFIKEKFETYNDFANAGIEDILGKDKIKNLPKKKEEKPEEQQENLMRHFSQIINIANKFQKGTKISEQP